jgi:membrane protein YqaA with SNARE-associated domain
MNTSLPGEDTDVDPAALPPMVEDADPAAAALPPIADEPKPPVWQVLVKVGIALGVCIAIIVWTQRTPWAADFFTRMGWPGIFLASVISGFNLLVPVPVVAFLPAILQAGFPLGMTILVMSVGMGVADVLGSWLGRLGRQLTRPPDNRLTRWIEHSQTHHPNWVFGFTAFYAAFVPFPNEAIVIPLAYFGMPLWRIWLAVSVGNVVFNSWMGWTILQAAAAVG